MGMYLSISVCPPLVPFMLYLCHVFIIYTKRMHNVCVYMYICMCVYAFVCIFVYIYHIYLYIYAIYIVSKHAEAKSTLLCVVSFTAGNL